MTPVRPVAAGRSKDRRTTDRDGIIFFMAVGWGKGLPHNDMRTWKEVQIALVRQDIVARASYGHFEFTLPRLCRFAVF